MATNPFANLTPAQAKALKAAGDYFSGKDSKVTNLSSAKNRKALSDSRIAKFKSDRKVTGSSGLQARQTNIGATSAPKKRVIKSAAALQVANTPKKKNTVKSAAALQRANAPRRSM